MHPGSHAKATPDKPALIMSGSGSVVTYAELDLRSRQIAQLLREQGLRPGDVIAILLENHPRYLETAWGAIRSGLYLTTVNRHLSAAEASYIVADSGARALFTSKALHSIAAEIPNRAPDCDCFVMLDYTGNAAPEGFEAYADVISRHERAEIEDGPIGDFLLYSSGTTGKPKGIKRPLSNRPASPGSICIYEVQAEAVSRVLARKTDVHRLIRITVHLPLRCGMWKMHGLAQVLIKRTIQRLASVMYGQMRG